MNYKQLLLTLILGLSLLVNSGCPALLVGVAAGGAAGVGAVKYVGGELRSTEEVSLNRAWKATQKAILDLEFTITSKEKDVFDAQLIASGAADKRIKVRLKKQSETLTEIRMRIGVFGDESLSRHILEKIKKRL